MRGSETRDLISQESACWSSDWRGQVWPTALFSAGYGANVTATDVKAEEELADARGKASCSGSEARNLGAHAPVASSSGLDLIVVSPGVPAKLPLLETARAQGIPVWSEIELAWRFSARETRGDYRLERQDDDDFACGAHSEDREHSNSRRRKHRDAAACARGVLDGHDGHRRGNQQLSA